MILMELMLLCNQVYNNQLLHIQNFMKFIEG
jgi:hypothetical protein